MAYLRLPTLFPGLRLPVEIEVATLRLTGSEVDTLEPMMALTKNLLHCAMCHLHC